MEWKKEIKEEDLKDFVWASQLSRLNPNDITRLKRMYERYINYYKKVLVNWSCPNCVKEVILELLKFRDDSKIIETKKKGGRPKGSKNKKRNGSKNTKRKKS